MASQSLGLACVALAACLWGGWGVLLRGTPAADLPAANQVWLVELGALCAAIPGILRTPSAATMPLRAWFWVTLAGVSDGLSAVLFFGAMHHTTLSAASLTHHMGPLLVVFATLKRETLKSALLAAGLCSVGLTILLTIDSAADYSEGGMYGGALGLMSAAFFALHLFLSHKASLYFNAYCNFAHQRLPALAIVSFCCTTVPWQAAPSANLAAILGGLLISGFGSLLFFLGLSRCDLQKASVLTLLEPTSACLLGHLCFGEFLGLAKIFGVSLVIGGIFVIVEVEG